MLPPFKKVIDVLDVPTGNVTQTIVELIDTDHYYPTLKQFNYIRFSFPDRAAAIEFLKDLTSF